MKEITGETLKYLQDNLLVSLFIAVLVGFAATKTVAHGKKGNPALYVITGLLGTFLGQFAIVYFNLNWILDEVATFRFLFDLLAAYLGSFVIAALVHFIKPT